MLKKLKKKVNANILSNLKYLIYSTLNLQYLALKENILLRTAFFVVIKD